MCFEGKVVKSIVASLRIARGLRREPTGLPRRVADGTRILAFVCCCFLSLCIFDWQVNKQQIARIRLEAVLYANAATRR